MQEQMPATTARDAQRAGEIENTKLEGAGRPGARAG